MNYTEIPLIDYIDEDDSIDIYIHTKDRRVVVVKEIRTNLYIDNDYISVDHISLGQRVTFVMLREDFSHMEYRIKDRMPDNVIADDFNSKKVFDDIHSFIEEQIDPPDLLTEP